MRRKSSRWFEALVCSWLVVIVAAATSLCATADITDFGAVGNGSTNDTEAIQDALDYLAAQGGGTLVVPAGNYLIDNVGTAWTGIGYCLKWSGSNYLIIQGDDTGNAGAFSLPSHQRATVMLLLNEASGDVTVEQVQFQCPAPTSHTYQGPLGISVGQNGTAEGELHSLTVDDVCFTNLAVGVHGRAAAHWTITNSTFTIRGGAAYPSSYAEGINIYCATSPTHSITFENAVISGNDFYMDGTYDDHAIYLCVYTGDVTISDNVVHTKPTNAVFKLYNAGQPAMGDIVINDNTFGSHNLDAVSLAGDATCDTLEVSGNSATGGTMFFYGSFGPSTGLISGNTITSYTQYAVNVDRASILGAGGTVTVSGNDIDSYNTNADGKQGIRFRRLSRAECVDNEGNPSAAGSGAFWQAYNTTTLYATGNVTTGAPDYYFLNLYTPIDLDRYNSWNDTYCYYVDDGTRYNY